MLIETMLAGMLSIAAPANGPGLIKDELAAAPAPVVELQLAQSQADQIKSRIKQLEKLRSSASGDQKRVIDEQIKSLEEELRKLS